MHCSRAPLLLPLSALLSLAACDSGTSEAEAPAGDTEAAAAVDADLPSVNPAAPAPQTAGPGDLAATSETLPAALQGRWGITPADCTGGGAAKGLLIIGPRSLEFYESAATLQEIGQSSPASLRASFAFTGEGMSWQRDMSFALEQNGAVLLRREYGEDAAPGEIRYAKC